MGWEWCMAFSIIDYWLLHIYGPNIDGGPSQASFSGLAHTSVTTSLWLISDGDDDEVFMEHCYVAWCQCRPARHPLQIGPRNYLPAQAELSSDSVSFFLSMHRLGWARCWVNVDIASSYLSTLHTDMIMLLNIAQVLLWILILNKQVLNLKWTGRRLQWSAEKYSYS